MEPDIILADEPTGNLDTGSGSDVMSVLGGLSAQGRTLIVVTHDTALARRAHRLVEIRDGVVVRDAPTE
jgi:ABC-type lipoprotein export system ATPase subunit